VTFTGIQKLNLLPTFYFDAEDDSIIVNDYKLFGWAVSL
jgi:hypothetical protein